MSLSRKAINFDLSTNELKKRFSNTAEAYNQIKGFMLQNGFEHRQYSVYTSNEVMDEKQIDLLAKRLSRQFPWLPDCVQKFDVTDIGEQHDLTHLLSKNQQKIKAPDKQANLDRQEALKQKIEKIAKSSKMEKYRSSKSKDIER